MEPQQCPSCGGALRLVQNKGLGCVVSLAGTALFFLALLAFVGLQNTPFLLRLAVVLGCGAALTRLGPIGRRAFQGVQVCTECAHEVPPPPDPRE